MLYRIYICIYHARDAMEPIAEANGIALFLNDRSNTGYKGVCFKNGTYQVQWYSPDKSDRTPKALGKYQTALEGALAYARHAKAAGIFPETPSVPVEHDGVRLHLTGTDKSASGYKGVYQHDKQFAR